ncbi:MAG: hypothetical protein PHC75_05140 [Burkholderiales bacterium]|nr:hypothetical protein [Burkholderiales bacterium]
MKLNDFCLQKLAENIIEHKHILTPEVIELSLIYDYINQYITDIKLLVEMYEDTKEYALNLKYGDLDFFSALLENNYEEFIKLTDIMQQKTSITKSVDEMENNATALLTFINTAFANTHFRVDLLEYTQDLNYYVEQIKAHKSILLKH